MTTCTFALPLGLLQQYLRDSGDIASSDPTNFLIYLAIFFCGALGGYAAGGLTDSHHLQNGAAAAALATVVIQVGGIVRRAITHNVQPPAMSWIAATVLGGLLMATFGMFGAYVHRSTHSSGTDTDNPTTHHPEHLT